MNTRIHPAPVTIREVPDQEIRPGVSTFSVDVYFAVRMAVALLFSGTGATAIFAALACVHILGWDQVYGGSAMLLGFGLLGIGAVVAGHALKEWRRV